MQTSSYNSNHKFIINSIWNIDNNAIIIGGFPVDSVIKNLPAKQETWVQSVGREDPLEKQMATHSRILAWEVPWLEELGRLRSMMMQRIRHDFSSVHSLSRVRLFETHEPQHARPPCPSPTARVYPIPCPLSQWCHPAISSSVVFFSSCPQSFPASGSFQMSQLFASGRQSIGVSASTSILPMNTQDWSPLGWTDWISLQSKGLSRVFSNTTVQKQQFFGAQFSSQSNSHIHTWLLEKP